MGGGSTQVPGGYESFSRERKQKQSTETQLITRVRLIRRMVKNES